MTVVEITMHEDSRPVARPREYLGREVWHRYFARIRRAGGSFVSKTAGHAIPLDQVRGFIEELRISGFRVELDRQVLDALMQEDPR